MIADQLLPSPPKNIIAPFKPHPWQVAPWRDKSPIILLTGSAGGGKSLLAAEKVHGFCLHYPGATGLVLRKTRESMINSTVLFLDRRVVGADPNVRHYSSYHRFEYRRSKSILAYGGMADEKQREQIRSVGQDGSVDIAWLEEATQFTESDFNELLSRMRGKAAPWTQIILSCNPDAPEHWINRRLILGGEAKVYYSSSSDNPSNPPTYKLFMDRLTGVQKLRLVDGMWARATGLIYEDWVDGPEGGNVTEKADYIPGGGPIYWGVDDGYAGQLDPVTKMFTPESHPRAFGIYQLRHDGTLCLFWESYRVKALSDQHIKDVLAECEERKWPLPEFVVVDKSAAELKGRFHAEGMYTRNGAADVEQSIKELTRWIAPDENKKRRFLVHSRCTFTRSEYVNYRRDETTGKPVKAHDHGPDRDRYTVWALRYEYDQE